MGYVLPPPPRERGKRSKRLPIPTGKAEKFNWLIVIGLLYLVAKCIGVL